MERWCRSVAESAVRVAPTAVRFQLCDADLPILDSYRYLGVILDAWLRWELHMQDITKRIRASAQLITRLINSKGNPDLPVIRHLVLALLVSVIAYGGHVWSPLALAVTAPRGRKVYEAHELGADRSMTAAARALQSSLAAPLWRSLGFSAGSHVHNQSVLVECGVPDVIAICERAMLAFVTRAIKRGAADATHALIRKHTVGYTNAFMLPSLGAALEEFRPPAPHPLCLENKGRSNFAQEVTARELSDGALRSAFFRWSRQVECKDLVRLRTACPIPRRCERHGMARYLAIFSREEAIALSRLRFNRSDLNDSRYRRRFRNCVSRTCERCDLGLPDTPGHFFNVCPALADVREEYHNGWLPFHDTAAMLGELPADALPRRSAHDDHLRVLQGYYALLRADHRSP